MKFAILHLDALFERSRRSQALSLPVKQAQQAWTNKIKAAEALRERQLAELKTARDPTRRLELQRQAQGTDMELSYLRQHSEADLRALVQQIQQTIGRELEPHLANFAKEHQLSAIFASPATPILYADPAIDKTVAIIAYFDARAPK
jgi:Skp family chaperone for outer membrane proteins